MLIRIFFILFVSLLLNSTQAENNITKREFTPEIQALKKNFYNIKSFKIEENKFIYIAQGDFYQFIFEYDRMANTIKQISIVWNFIALAKECEGIDQKNIYFAQNKEYYLMGGWNEDPDIRIFDLYNPQPWHDNYLEIVPSMNYVGNICKFHTPLLEKLEKAPINKSSKELNL